MKKSRQRTKIVSGFALGRATRSGWDGFGMARGFRHLTWPLCGMELGLVYLLAYRGSVADRPHYGSNPEPLARSLAQRLPNASLARA